MKNAISPTRNEDYSQWYQEVIKAADMAEHSTVRGCMIIKPWGYAIWENIQSVLDSMIKETGHQNVYFPLFIPLSYFEKEASHVEGFAKECAVVTHHRLEKTKEGKLIPAGELEEPLIVRPTSEMIIGSAFSKWVESYRDLPILINQWANIVRWEMRTRLFLRTAEFLWQEGHTAHSTKEEAHHETKKMLDLYFDFAHQYLACPVIKGRKTEAEKFPGAEITYSIEAMMQDRKALQAGTSHFLGQNFAKASNIKFRNEKQEIEYAWTSSWGVTTRLIGAIVMTHSDDNGLVLPPRIAPKHVMILPLIHNPESKKEVMSYCEKIKNELASSFYEGKGLKVEIDTRDLRGGEKKWEWIKKGVPLILEIGLKEVEKQTISFIIRDTFAKEEYPKVKFVEKTAKILENMQERLLEKALDFRQKNTKIIDSKEEFYQFFTPKKEEEIHGGFALVHFCEDLELEGKIQEELKVSVRGIPLDGIEEEGKCIFTGRPSKKRVIFAKAY
jgi:prolyl-tRNA synthetase